jgi:hypothetical protein
MMWRVSCLGLVLCWGIIASAAPAQVALAWKLKEGSRLYLEDKIALKQNVKHMQVDHVYELAFTRLTRLTVLKENNDGGLLVEQKIERIKVDRAGTTENASPKMLRAQGGQAPGL